MVTVNGEGRVYYATIVIPALLTNIIQNGLPLVYAALVDNEFYSLRRRDFSAV